LNLRKGENNFSQIKDNMRKSMENERDRIIPEEIPLFKL
jgi:hypothetical protein